MPQRPVILLLLILAFACGCRTVPVTSHSTFSRFTGLDHFDTFARSQTTNGETILLSPPLPAGMDWNQLVVSWNATAPPGTWLKIEAAALSPGHRTKFFNLGLWSPDNLAFPRTSQSDQTDPDGTVNVDTLELLHPAQAVQIRLTLGGAAAIIPTLKFLGLSFCNPRVPPPHHPPNHAAWGKTIPTPGYSQRGWPDGQGWCSPTSLTMVLARWADVLHRPDLKLPVPATAAAVFDQDFGGTGNWPFNTAFAGSFPGLRAEVTRLDDLSEVEDWIAAGLPVILSTRWDYLAPGRPSDSTGHLIVCTGFTSAGDVIVNDPAIRLDRHPTVQCTYRRADILRAWAQSHHTVYLVYPETATLPGNRFAQW